MTSRNELLAAVTALEKTLQGSAQLGDENFRENKKAVIQLRREIAIRVSDVLTFGSAIEDPIFRDAFRREFSKMRSAMALHHASWPVVAIDLDDVGYQASIQAMRVAYRAFFAWARSAK